MKNSEFFDNLSSDYDDMINFENSIKNKMESLKNFISQKSKTVLDLGCGTGVDSITLTKLGLTVDAVDHSKGMLERAKLNSKKINANINFINSGLGELTIKNKTYDLIVSLGNTIPNINKLELKTLLKKLYGYLNTGGTIVIQIVNYSKLPQKGIHILNEFENDTISIVRKYNINDNDIDFIIDKTNKLNNQTNKIITKLYPHSKIDFEQYAEANSFDVEFFGSLNKELYSKEKSGNLIVVLKK